MENLDVYEKINNDSQVPDGCYKNKVYVCDSCGTEISVVDDKEPTFCICCGNTQLSFARETMTFNPDKIIPFKISREEALRKVSEEFLDGFFLPSELKHCKPDMLQRIYIPYYLFKVESDTSVLVKVLYQEREYSTWRYKLRFAFDTFPSVTVDALQGLKDESSMRIEPYKLSNCVPFDAKYLKGCFSGVADVPMETAVEKAKDKVRLVVDSVVLDDLKDCDGSILAARRTAEIYKLPETAMFPAWFLTYTFRGKLLTIVVNGQTGQVIGDVPIDKKKLLIATLIYVIVGASVCGYISYELFYSMLNDLSFPMICAMSFFAYAVYKAYVTLKKNLTRSDGTFFSYTEHRK